MSSFSFPLHVRRARRWRRLARVAVLASLCVPCSGCFTVITGFGRAWGGSGGMSAETALVLDIVTSPVQVAALAGYLIYEVTEPIAKGVVGGAGDCAAGAVGNGIVRAGSLSTSLGTSGVAFVHSDELKVDKLGRVHTFCHAVRGKWHMMGVTLSAAGSLQWFRNTLCKELREKADAQGDDVYDLLTAEAAQTPVGADGLFFLPYLSGERTPHADPYARGSFVGLTLAHDRGRITRSILEGVCYSLREAIDIFRGLGVPIDEIRASGGGAKSPFWRQIQADVFGSKVTTLNSEEGPAFGVALLAAVGGGEYKNIEEACDATIKRVSELDPNPDAQKKYDAAFPVYQKLYRSLKEDFRAIADLA